MSRKRAEAVVERLGEFLRVEWEGVHGNMIARHRLALRREALAQALQDLILPEQQDHD